MQSFQQHPHRFSLEERQKNILSKDALNTNTLYCIECCHNQLFLREEARSHHPNDIIRIMGAMNPSKISYGSLWMIKQFKDMYEIIHYKTDMVITTDGSEVRLDAGKAKSNQLFRTISVNRIVNDKPIMTIEDSNKNFLFLDGVLQCSNQNILNGLQEFIFKEYGLFECAELHDTCFILVQGDDLCLDLINGSRNGECEVELYEKHYRNNQRWQIINKTEHDYVRIRNVLTKKYLVYDQEKKKILQSQHSEQWHIVYEGDVVTIFNMNLKLYLSHADREIEMVPHNPRKWIIFDKEMVRRGKRQWSNRNSR